MIPAEGILPGGELPAVELHQRFTVGQFRQGTGPRRWAIFHQKPPVDLGDGWKRISLRFPVLVAAKSLDGQEASLNRIAAILNANWETSQ